MVIIKITSHVIGECSEEVVKRILKSVFNGWNAGWVVEDLEEEIDLTG